jgi:hypothetical protein
MSKENYLKFGDIIYIEYGENSVLFSSGFYQSSLYFAQKDQLSLKSFRNGLFQVYPNFSYKDHVQVRKLKDELKRMNATQQANDEAYNFL